MLIKDQKNRCPKINQTGVAIIELLVALGISSLMLTAAVLVAFGGQTAGLDVGLTNGGLYRLDNHLGSTLALVMGDWDAETGEILVDSDSFYTGQSVVSNITPCLKRVSAGIAWTSEKNREQNISLNTLVSSTTATKALGDDCDSFPSGDWDNPYSPVSDNITGQSNATDVDLKNGFIYLTTNSPSAGQDDFFIYKFDSEALSLTFSSSLNTGAGLMALDVAGNYAYVLSEDTDQQFMVINITNPANPTVVATKDLPDAPNGVGRSVFYYDGRVYIGTQFLACPPSCTPEQNNEFHVFDVPDPNNPAWLGSLNVNHNINEIFVMGDYAYLATTDDTGELMIIDISDPSGMGHPDDTGMKFNAGGPASHDGMSVYVLGDRAYLGLKRGNGSSVPDDFYVLDVADPIDITKISSRDLGLSTNSGIVGVRVNNKLAFLAIDSPTIAFRILNITDPALPDYTTCNHFNLSENTTALDMAGNFIVTANRSNAEIRIISDQTSACTP